MRLSDLQIADAPIPVDPAVMKRNATTSSLHVDYRATKIHVSQAAREQDPFRNVARSNCSYGRDNAAVSYARDADTAYVDKFLPPDRLCSEVVSGIYEKAYDQQLNPETRGFWSGLIAYLMGMPKGSRIRDCRKATLSTLLSKTLAA